VDIASCACKQHCFVACAAVLLVGCGLAMQAVILILSCDLLACYTEPASGVEDGGSDCLWQPCQEGVFGAGFARCSEHTCNRCSCLVAAQHAVWACVREMAILAGGRGGLRCWLRLGKALLREGHKPVVSKSLAGSMKKPPVVVCCFSMQGCQERVLFGTAVCLMGGLPAWSLPVNPNWVHYC